MRRLCTSTGYYDERLQIIASLRLTSLHFISRCFTSLRCYSVLFHSVGILIHVAAERIGVVSLVGWVVSSWRGEQARLSLPFTRIRQ